MNGVEAVADPPTTESGKKLRQARSLYLRPEQWRDIDDACFDLAAKHREKQSPSRVMERFADRYFAKFLAEELTVKRAAAKRKKDGGDE